MSVISNSGNGRVICVVYSPEGMSIPDGNEPVLNIPFRILDSEYQMSEGRFHFEDVLLAASCTEIIPVEIEPVNLKTNGVLPETWSLSQNYPNPFNPETTIRFSLPKSEHVTLSIYNLQGRLIEVLMDDQRPAGNYEVVWNGASMSSGIYLCRLNAGRFVEMKKLILQK